MISLSTLEQAIAGNVDGSTVTRMVLRSCRNRYNSDKVAEVSYASKSSWIFGRWHLLIQLYSHSGQGLPCPEVP